jgi:hypothetical protein
MRTPLGQSCVLGNMPNALYAHFAKIVDNPQTFLPQSHVGPVLQRVTELVPEFSALAYMTDTQLSRLTWIPEKGMGEYLTLLSICETCKYKGIRFLDFLRSGEQDIDVFIIDRYF